MFRFDDDQSEDGERLKENMKEIKEMIEQQDQQIASGENKTPNLENRAEKSQGQSKTDPSNFQETNKEQNSESKDRLNESQKSRKTRTKADIPEPPETKQLDIPDIEKGPLFIRQTKFTNASKMIREMRKVSQEMKEIVRRLEQGVEEDKQTERQARELLNELEDNRKHVEDVVSPEEN